MVTNYRIAGYPYNSFSVSIKGKSNDYKKYTQSIATFINNSKLDFEENTQSNTSTSEVASDQTNIKLFQEIKRFFIDYKY